MEFPFIIAIFLIFSGGVIGWTFYATKKRRENWALVAKSLGVEFANDMILGRVEGVQISVAIESRGSGKSRHDVTVFRGNIAGDVPVGLSIVAEGAFAKVAKIFGSEDIQIGLSDLDSKMMVKAADAEELRNWGRQENVRSGLRQVCNLPSFKIDYDTLSFEIRGSLSDVDKVQFHITELVMVVELLSANALADTKVESAQSEQDGLW